MPFCLLTPLCNFISIHLMLRFNIADSVCRICLIVISIHLMLRFNSVEQIKAMFLLKFQYILCYGSTRHVSACAHAKTLFQYILCYGSTGRQSDGTMIGTNFNTSYVTVQHRLLEWLGLCLIYFNTSYVTVQPVYEVYYKGNYMISIHLMLRFNRV